jgi:hypothetical protein
LAASIDGRETFAAAPASVLEILEHDTPAELAVDYASDPDLDAIIADGKALWLALSEGPILVAGSELIN